MRSVTAELSQDAEANGAATLGMELRRTDVLVLDRRTKRMPTVIAGRQFDGFLFRVCGEGMYEINGGRFVFQRRQNRALPVTLAGEKSVPADVGNLLSFPGYRLLRDGADFALEDTKPRVIAEFLAHFEQNLHADADTKQGATTTHEVDNCLGVAADLDFFHAVAEGTDPGHDKSCRCHDGFGGADNFYFGSDMLECPGDVEKVAGTVVEDADSCRFHVFTPF